MKDEGLFQAEEQSIDFRKWLILFLNYWYLFAGSLVLAMMIVFLYIKTIVPKYELSVNILVRNDSKPLDKAQFFDASLIRDPYQIENEKAILKARSVTRETLLELNFFTEYYSQGKFHKTELYTNSPFTVERDSIHLQPVGILFEIRFINDTSIAIHAEAENVFLYDYSRFESPQQLNDFRFDDTIKFGQITGNQFCRFSLIPGFRFGSLPSVNKKYYFRFRTLQELTARFQQFEIINKSGSSTMQVAFRHEIPKKASDFLNTLTKKYLKKGITRDNLIAEATIGFIDAQLGNVVDSLMLSGNQLRNYKSSNKVMDIDIQSEKVFSKLQSLETEKVNLMVKQRYFNYLLENLNSRTEISELVAPTTLNINDPILNNLILELAGLYSERSELSYNSISSNPYIKSLEQKIEDTRQKLSEAARNSLNAIAFALDENKNQISISEATLDKFPGDQQKLQNMQRSFNLNDELYTYLLTRRSEMEIFKASNIPLNEVLDDADIYHARLVSPNRKMYLLISLFFGLGIPAILLYIRETYSTRIQGRKDIQKISTLPILGYVYRSNTPVFPETPYSPNSIISEAYRMIRTNLQFVIDEKKSNVILITSAIKGEGKSFTALNLAAIYAMYGKKTILVDTDMRKSNMSELLGLSNKKGLSTYLSNNDSLDAVCISFEHPKFDIIPAGPLPPNPSELIASSHTAVLFEKLRKDYEIIIVDAPPMGIIADALMLYTHARIMLLIVRNNYTSRIVLSDVMEDLATRKMDKINILLNDIDLSKERYGYAYSYAHKYYAGQNHKS